MTPPDAKSAAVISVDDDASVGRALTPKEQRLGANTSHQRFVFHRKYCSQRACTGRSCCWRYSPIWDLRRSSKHAAAQEMERRF